MSSSRLGTIHDSRLFVDQQGPVKEPTDAQCIERSLECFLRKRKLIFIFNTLSVTSIPWHFESSSIQEEHAYENGFYYVCRMQEGWEIPIILISSLWQRTTHFFVFKSRVQGSKSTIENSHLYSMFEILC